MAGRTKFGDLVILVPGIFGSRLVHEGRLLWGDDSPTFLQWARRHGSDLGRLSVAADDPSLEDLGDGITADGVVDGPFVAGRFLRVPGYGPLTAFLQKALSLRLGENLHLFAYDWRRDIRVAGRRLAEKADGWLQAWRSRSGNPDARIVLVCHAMGGLVGRAYADIEGGWPVVRKIVSIGTPYLGTLRALDLLYFGFDFQKYALPIHDLTSVARTLTSIYQLLPHYPAIRTFGGKIVSPFELRIPTFELSKIERARQFHRDLLEHQTRNNSKGGYGAMHCRTIIGVGQPTIEVGRLLPNGTLAIDGEPVEHHDGDGTVPRFSAEAPAPSGFAASWVYWPQTHGMLIADPVVHDHVRDAIHDHRKGAPPSSTPLPRVTLRRDSKDLMRVASDGLALDVAHPFYKVNQTVDIRVGAYSASGEPFDAAAVRVSAKVEQVRAVAKRVATKRMRLVPDRKRPGWWSGALKAAAPGTYRVTVTSPHRWLSAFRVSDLFEVDVEK
jgi:hypothetical protein